MTRPFTAPILALALLQACSTAPVEQGGMQPVSEESAEAPQPEPELTLNLPGGQCECGAESDPLDRTLLDRGLTALVQGDHIDALQYFQRYRRLEKTALADWESGVAIAFLATLQDSPLWDPDEAYRSARDLKKRQRDDWQVDQRIRMMLISLESFRVMYRHVGDLQGANATLQEDLAKREEAIRRLRELTLGQTEARP